MEVGATDQRNNSRRASTQEGSCLKVVLPSLKGSGGEDGWGGSMAAGDTLGRLTVTRGLNAIVLYSLFLL